MPSTQNPKPLSQPRWKKCVQKKPVGMNFPYTLPKRESVSTVIELEFETQIDLDFIERGIVVRLTRLTASVQLQTTEG